MSWCMSFCLLNCWFWKNWFFWIIKLWYGVWWILCLFSLRNLSLFLGILIEMIVIFCWKLSFWLCWCCWVWFFLRMRCMSIFWWCWMGGIGWCLSSLFGLWLMWWRIRIWWSRCFRVLGRWWMGSCMWWRWICGIVWCWMRWLRSWWRLFLSIRGWMWRRIGGRGSLIILFLWRGWLLMRGVGWLVVEVGGVM